MRQLARSHQGIEQRRRPRPRRVPAANSELRPHGLPSVHPFIRCSELDRSSVPLVAFVRPCALHAVVAVVVIVGSLPGIISSGRPLKGWPGRRSPVL